MSRWVAAAILLSFSFFSCSSKEAVTPPAETQRSAAPVAYQAGEARQAIPTKRMIVQTAELRLIVKDAPKAMEAVQKVVADQRGYVATSKTWKQDGQPSSQVRIRVPAERLDATLRQLRALALDIESESLSGEDVTEEYVDLQASLRNEQAYEKELLELMTQTRQRTANADDLLAVYNRVNEVRERITKMQGRMQFLEKSSAMATIDLQLIPSALAQPVNIAGWHPTGTVRTSIRALLRALQVLVDIVIVLVIVAVPLALIVILPLIGALRIVRRWWPKTQG